MNPLFLFRQEMTPIRKLLLMKAMAGGGRLTEYDATPGNPLTFNTDVDQPLPLLKAYFTPVQSGSGDPSPTNVRAISGWTGVTVYQQDGGKNVFPNIDGSFAYLPQSVLGTRYLVFSGERTGSGTERIYAYKADGTVDDDWAVNNYDSVTGRYYRAFACRDYVIGFMAKGFTNCQLQTNPTQSATPDVSYSAYTGTTIPVTFPAVGKNLCNAVQSGIRYKSSNNFTCSIIGQQATFDVTTGGSNFILLDICEITEAMVGKKYVFATVGGWTNDALVSCNKYGGDRRQVTDGIIAQSDVGKMLTLRLYPGSNTGVSVVSNIQVEQANSPTAYEPYTNTVYGGYVDLTAGELVATCKKARLVDFSFTSGSNGRWQSNIPSDFRYGGAWLSDFYVSTLSGATSMGDYSIKYPANATSTTFLIRDTGLTNENMSTRLGEHVLIYGINPITYPITPEQITALKGDNVIWSDANGDIEAKYLKKG